LQRIKIVEGDFHPDVETGCHSFPLSAFCGHVRLVLLSVSGSLLHQPDLERQAASGSIRRTGVTGIENRKKGFQSLPSVRRPLKTGITCQSQNR
jgi:hypothetical protein